MTLGDNGLVTDKLCLPVQGGCASLILSCGDMHVARDDVTPPPRAIAFLTRRMLDERHSVGAVASLEQAVEPKPHRDRRGWRFHGSASSYQFVSTYARKNAVPHHFKQPTWKSRNNTLPVLLPISPLWTCTGARGEFATPGSLLRRPA